MEQFAVGMLVNAKVGAETIFGRVEKIYDNGKITISDGNHLYDVKAKDIVKEKFNAISES